MLIVHLIIISLIRGCLLHFHSFLLVFIIFFNMIVQVEFHWLQRPFWLLLHLCGLLLLHIREVFHLMNLTPVKLFFPPQAPALQCLCCLQLAQCSVYCPLFRSMCASQCICLTDSKSRRTLPIIRHRPTGLFNEFDSGIHWAIVLDGILKYGSI